MEKQKEENEKLKKRIRELEASKKNERRGVERTDSVDTTASNQGSVYHQKPEARGEMQRSPLAALEKEIEGGESAAGTAE